MNIVFVSNHACGRTAKMAMSLLDRNHIVHHIATKIPHAHEYLTTFSFVLGLDQYTNAIKLYAKDADIFHVHNEPSWFVTLIKEHTDVPVIIDVHDSFVSRVTEEEMLDSLDTGKKAFRATADERNNFQAADGLVFPSEPFGKMIIDEYRLKQPSLVLPSYVYSKEYQYGGGAWYGGLVYQGRVDLKEEIESKELMKGFKYCDYEELAKELTKKDILFHLYAVRSDDAFLDKYKDTAIVHGGKPYSTLIQNLMQHDWGLVGNLFYTPQWEVAFPNKLFEYMAASVPIVAMNATECGRFVKKHELGIEVSSVQELKDRWLEHEQCRINVIKKRQQFTMDVHIHTLENFYKKIIDGTKV